MKTLLALLALSGALAAGYWKTQNPDGDLDTFKAQLASTGERLKGGFDAVRDGSSAAQARQADLATQQADLATQQADLATRQADLATRLETLESASASRQGADNAVIEGRLTDAERRLDAADRRFEATGARLDTLSAGQPADALQSEIDALRDSSQAILARLDRADEQLTALVHRVQAAEGQSQLLARRLDEQTTADDIAALDERLGAIAQDVNTLRESSDSQGAALDDRIATLDEKTALLTNRFDTVTSDMTGGAAGDAGTVTAMVDQRLAEVEARLDTTNTDSRRIEALAERLETARRKIAQLEADATRAVADQATLQQQVAALNTANESMSIDKVQNSIQEQLASLRAEMETRQQSATRSDATSSDDTNADLAALTSALDTSRERIQALEQRLLNLPASSSEASTAQEMQSLLQTQIADLEKRLSSSAPTTDPALVDTLTEMREQVSELASRAYVTQDDLVARQQGKSVEYKIYFDRNSTAISEDAARVLNSFITQEKNRATGVSIYGFTDRRGPAEYNQQLALQRANNVRAYLLQNGLDFSLIDNVAGLGEDAAAAQLEDGEEDAQQRTVVLFARQP